MTSTVYSQVCENLNNTVTLRVIANNTEVMIENVKIDTITSNEKFRILTEQGVALQFNFNTVLEVRTSSMDGELATPRDMDDEYEIVDNGNREAYLLKLNNIKKAISEGMDMIGRVNTSEVRILPCLMSYDKTNDYVHYFIYDDMTYAISNVNDFDYERTEPRKQLFSSDEVVAELVKQLDEHISKKNKINIVLVNGITQADYLPLNITDREQVPCVTLFNFTAEHLDTIPIRNIKLITKVCFAQAVMQEKPKVDDGFYIQANRRVIEKFRKENRSIAFMNMAWRVVDLSLDTDIEIKDESFIIRCNKYTKLVDVEGRDHNNWEKKDFEIEFFYKDIQYLKEILKIDNQFDLQNIKQLKEISNTSIYIYSSFWTRKYSETKQYLTDLAAKDATIMFLRNDGKYMNKYMVKLNIINQPVFESNYFEIRETNRTLTFYYDELYKLCEYDEEIYKTWDNSRFEYLGKVDHQIIAYTIDRCEEKNNQVEFLTKFDSWETKQATNVFIEFKSPITDSKVKFLDADTGMYSMYLLSEIYKITVGKEVENVKMAGVTTGVIQDNMSRLETNIKNNHSSIIYTLKDKKPLKLRLVNVDYGNSLVCGINVDTQKAEARNILSILHVKCSLENQDHPVVEKVSKSKPELTHEQKVSENFNAEIDKFHRESSIVRIKVLKTLSDIICVIYKTGQQCIDVYNLENREFNIIPLKDITYAKIATLEDNKRFAEAKKDYFDIIKSNLSLYQRLAYSKKIGQLTVWMNNKFYIEIYLKTPIGNIKIKGYITSINTPLITFKKDDNTNLTIHVSNILDAKVVEGISPLDELSESIRTKLKKFYNDKDHIKIYVKTPIETVTMKGYVTAIGSYDIVFKSDNGSKLGINIENILDAKKVEDISPLDKISESIRTQLNYFFNNKTMIRVHRPNVLVDVIGEIKKLNDNSMVIYDLATFKEIAMPLANDLSVSVVDEITNKQMTEGHNLYKWSKEVIEKIFEPTTNQEEKKEEPKGVTLTSGSVIGEKKEEQSTLYTYNKITKASDSEMIEYLKNVDTVKFTYNNKKRVVQIEDLGTTFFTGTVLDDHSIKSFTYSCMTDIAIVKPINISNVFSSSVEKIKLINKFNETKKTLRRKFTGLLVKIKMSNDFNKDVNIIKINNQYMTMVQLDNKDVITKYFSRGHTEILSWLPIDPSSVSSETVKTTSPKGLVDKQTEIGKQLNSLDNNQMIRLYSRSGSIFVGNNVKCVNNSYVYMKDNTGKNIGLMLSMISKWEKEPIITTNELKQEVKMTPIINEVDKVKNGDRCTFTYHNKLRTVDVTYVNDYYRTIQGQEVNTTNIKSFSKNKITDLKIIPKEQPVNTIQNDIANLETGDKCIFMYKNKLRNVEVMRILGPYKTLVGKELDKDGEIIGVKRFLKKNMTNINIIKNKYNKLRQELENKLKAEGNLTSEYGIRMISNFDGIVDAINNKKQLLAEVQPGYRTLFTPYDMDDTYVHAKHNGKDVRFVFSLIRL